jgi:hypothetical protein
MCLLVCIVVVGGIQLPLFKVKWREMRRTPPFDTHLKSSCIVSVIHYILFLLYSSISLNHPHHPLLVIYTLPIPHPSFSSEPTFETPIILRTTTETPILLCQRMPLPSLHPSLPQNPTTNMASSSSSYFSSGAGRAVGSTVGASGGSGAGSGGVNRETLKGLQDVVWSDDEVSHVSFRVFPYCSSA